MKEENEDNCISPPSDDLHHGSEASLPAFNLQFSLRFKLDTSIIDVPLPF